MPTPKAIEAASDWCRTRPVVGLRDELAELLDRFAAQREAESNPAAKIFDHKWLDPECVENGCKSLSGAPPQTGVGDAVADYVDIVFDGPPSHESGRFVEVENSEGASIKFGEWVHREDGYWALRINRDSWREGAEAMREDCADAAENRYIQYGGEMRRGIAMLIRALPIPRSKTK